MTRENETRHHRGLGAVAAAMSLRTAARVGKAWQVQGLRKALMPLVQAHAMTLPLNQAASALRRLGYNVRMSTWFGGAPKLEAVSHGPENDITGMYIRIMRVESGMTMGRVFIDVVRKGDRAGEFKSVASIRMDETGDVDGDGFSASTLEFVRAIGMRMWA